MSTTGMDRTVRAAVVVHVVVVVAFLVAVAAGAEVRLLLALAGGVLATVAWIGWGRSVAVQVQLMQPSPTRALPTAGTTVLSSARVDPGTLRHATPG